MNISPYLLCPVCREPLRPNENLKGLSCSNRHLFDRAKQGYHNLLLSQNKKSKHPGDTSEMVAARRDFLNKAYYKRLSTTFIELVKSHIRHNNDEDFHYCDLACGEGYYTHELHQQLCTLFSNVYTTGIDISTPAIKSACRRNKSIQWLVGSAAKIPLENDSQDFVSGLFFHFDLEELSRVLKPGAHIILVNTGPKHLIELRQVIYDELKPESRTEFDSLPASIQHVETRTFEDLIHLSEAKDILNLFSMTPHYWRCKPEKRLQLESLTQLSLQLDIQFDVFRKRTAQEDGQEK